MGERAEVGTLIRERPEMTDCPADGCIKEKFVWNAMLFGDYWGGGLLVFRGFFG